jgi:hemerythrin-like domain-containing protein
MSGPAKGPGPGDLLPFLRSHECMRADVDRMRDVLLRSRLDEPRRAAFAAYWQGFAGVLEHHHTYEDETVLPQLLDKARAHRPLCDRTTEQHRNLDALLDRMATLVAGFASGAVGQEPVARLVIEIDGVLDEHLDHEEEFVVPLFLRAFSRDEWMAMEGTNIVTLRARGLLPFALPWTHHGLYPGLLRVALSLLPDAEREEYDGTWLPRYERLRTELWNGHDHRPPADGTARPEEPA